jgi:muramoyltetrapeptide carboxypeptidase
VSPSGPFDRERLQPGLQYLSDRGYHIREGASLYARDRYLAGSDAARADEVNAMFADPDVRAVLTARGGYGSGRILDLVDYDAVARDPKPFVGFSDTTALQLALLEHADLVTYTGITLCADVKKAGMDPVTESTLWQALEAMCFDPIEGLRVLRGGAAAGPLVGGCLSLVASLVGTPYLPNFSGALLYLEDVNEAPYRVDRMLNQLHMAGILREVGALLFGRFEGCDPEREAEGPVEAVLETLVDQVDCPVYANLPYGHGVGRRVLPVGMPAQVSDDGMLRIGDHE